MNDPATIFFATSTVVLLVAAFLYEMLVQRYGRLAREASQHARMAIDCGEKLAVIVAAETRARHEAEFTWDFPAAPLFSKLA